MSNEKVEADALATVDPFDVDFTHPPGQHPGVGDEHVASCPRRSGAGYCWCQPRSSPGKSGPGGGS